MRSVLIVLAATLAFTAPLRDIRPVLESEALAGDPDDPAIWLNPNAPDRSLIVGTLKEPAPNGALVVFTLSGKIAEVVSNIDRPNNVDIQGDIVVTTERYQHQLRVYRISEEKPHLRLLGTVPVFGGEAGERSEPMGIALYERPSDKALFAVVSRKTGPADGYIWQYRLHVGNTVTATKVREFGLFSSTAEIEAVAVDDAAGLTYYSDEDCCIRVYRADPDAADSGRELAQFGTSGFTGNREGIAIAGEHVIVTDQIEQRSEYHVFRRDNWQEVDVWRGTADSTDGIEASVVPLGNLFPRGLLVTMNSAARNFQFYSLPLD